MSAGMAGPADAAGSAEGTPTAGPPGAAASASQPATSPAPQPAPDAPGLWSQRSLPDLALLAMTVLALVLCWLIARPFLTSLAWAAALAVVGWPLHRQVVRRVRSPTAAAAASVLAIALLLVVPSALLMPGIIDEAAGGYQLIKAQVESNAWDAALARYGWLGTAWEWLKQRVNLGDVMQHAGTLLTGLGTLALRTSFVGLMELALTFFFLFYFLRDRDAVLASMRALLPMSAAESDGLLRTAGATLFATVCGKVLVGIVQGALGGLMFWWLGLPAAWFWALVMGILSIVPLLGPPLVWAPAALFLLLDGHWGQATILAVWGAAVVGVADNLLYPIVVGRYLRLHTVPLLVALIGGLVVFGAVGFFLGPVVLAVALALLDVWRARAARA